MKVIETNVTYLDQNDLVKFARDLPIKEINHWYVLDRELFLKAEVIILEKDGEYKVLKSRY